MIWKKLKHIFCPSDNYPWMISHASYPWAEQINNSLYRIYFSCRDKCNVSSIGSIEFDLEKLVVKHISSKPELSHGEIGTFDDSGVSMACLLNVADSKYLYYLGWNLMVNIPWRNTVGLAIKEATSINFEKYSKAPILGINHYDPFTLTYPYILFDEGIYKMWYGSSLFWGPQVQNTSHVIKYATSNDGINWQTSNHICIKPNDEDEFAIVKPFVLKENGFYKMWYSFRNQFYNLGYATSTDGLNWIRNDEEVGIDVSQDGWDSEMICYPFVFDYNGNRYMLYNGNGYGKTGFGIAILENKS